MYFKEKGNTNIDSEFENNKKFNFDFNFNFKNLNIKPILFIISGIILLIVIILFIISITRNNSRYTLELLGAERVTITVGTDYIEPGYKAYDRNNKDYTSDVKITSNVDTSKVGDYEIMYSIGNIDKVRYVTVAQKIDTTNIRLSGDINMYLELGEKFIEPGYEAYDSQGKNITSKVKVSGSVNTNKLGIYQLTYSIKNSSNINITKTRTIVVVEKGKKPNN